MITEEIAQSVLDVIRPGLCKGVGTPEPGHMCVEAAVCFALGQPHGDRPECVAHTVRGFTIGLNDAPWFPEGLLTANEVRARGLQKVAVAQLGSKGTIDEALFAWLITYKVAQLLADALEERGIPADNFRRARSPVDIANADFWTGDHLLGDLFSPTSALRIAAYYLLDAENFRSKGDAECEGSSLRGAISQAGIASRISKSGNSGLRRLADICLEALKECCSPGCELLYLCD